MDALVGWVSDSVTQRLKDFVGFHFVLTPLAISEGVSFTTTEDTSRHEGREVVPLGQRSGSPTYKISDRTN